jgi:hypothetical protein
MLYKAIAFLMVCVLSFFAVIVPAAQAAAAVTMMMSEPDDATIQFHPYWKVAVQVIDWLARIWFLLEFAGWLQDKITEIGGDSGTGWWEHTGEIACDISNGLVSWR